MKSPKKVIDNALESVQAEKMLQKNDNIVDYVQEFFNASSVVAANGDTLQDVFQKAAQMHEFLVVFKDHLAVQAAVALPKVVQTLIKQAEKGNVPAAKLLCEISGSVGKVQKESVVNALQINITPEQRAVLESDFLDVTPT